MLARLFASRGGQIAARIAILAVILIFWEYAPGGRSVRFWASTPSAILSTLWGWIIDGSLWDHLIATLTTMLLGYVIGCAAGAGLGLILGFLPSLYRVLSPFIVAFYSLPKIALAPLFIIVLGVGLEAKVALVAITVFFLVLNATLDGVRNIDRDLIESLTLMGATQAEIIPKVFLPGALPWIFTGMRIAVRHAFTTTLLAELIAANSGLGFLIEYNTGNFNAAGAFAAILVLVVFSITLTELLTRMEHGMGHSNG
jgi:NitT/TauT family transport system permease protein